MIFIAACSCAIDIEMDEGGDAVSICLSVCLYEMFIPVFTNSYTTRLEVVPAVEEDFRFPSDINTAVFTDWSFSDPCFTF